MYAYPLCMRRMHTFVIKPRPIRLSSTSITDHYRYHRCLYIWFHFLHTHRELPYYFGQSLDARGDGFLRFLGLTFPHCPISVSLASPVSRKGSAGHISACVNFVPSPIEGNTGNLLVCHNGLVPDRMHGVALLWGKRLFVEVN